jgi:hypothetical protein
MENKEIKYTLVNRIFCEIYDIDYKNYFIHSILVGCV